MGIGKERLRRIFLSNKAQNATSLKVTSRDGLPECGAKKVAIYYR